MSLSAVVKLYKDSHRCVNCFEKGYGIVPDSGCRLPQPRWIGPQYWAQPEHIVVCMVNPGSGKQIEENYEKLLRDFFTGKKQFFHVNDYFRGAMRRWGGGKYLRVIEHHMNLDLNKIALMNIALCPMVDSNNKDTYPSSALEECFNKYTLEIMKELEPSYLVLCGSSIHHFKQRIEDHLGCKVLLAPHYASRLRLHDLQETYRKIRENLPTL